MANDNLSRRHFLASLAAFGAVPFLPPSSVPMNAVEGAIYSPITPGDTWRFVTEVYWGSTPIRLKEGDRITIDPARNWMNRDENRN